tara:strand:- start:9405 stop:9764 length:360 start_codon:yes stop_codon:yes gene_type:complete
MSQKTQEETVVDRKDYEEQLASELQAPVEADSELKTLIVNYVGQSHDPEDGNVTLEMIIETFAEEFKEFLLPIAEENFIRGYQQAISDVEEGEKFLKENPDYLKEMQAASDASGEADGA